MSDLKGLNWFIADTCDGLVVASNASVSVSFDAVGGSTCPYMCNK